MKTKSVNKKGMIGASILTALVMGSALPALAKPTVEVTVNNVPLARAKYVSDTTTIKVNDLKADDSRGAYLTWDIPSIGKTNQPCNDTNGGGNGGKDCPIKGQVPRGRVIKLNLCVIDLPPFANDGGPKSVCSETSGKT